MPRAGRAGWRRRLAPSNLLISDDASEEAGRLAARIGKLFDARALLVGVNPPRPGVRAGARATAVDSDVPKDHPKRDQSLEQRAAVLEGILGRRPRVEVTAGDAAATLRELAGRGEAATLVAVGRRDTGSAEGFALGSFPTSTLRPSGGPVLVVPSPGEARR